MIKEQEIQIFPRVQRSLDSLNESIRLFEDFLQEDSPPATADYYRARNLAKEGEAAFKDAVSNAKKLLGPLPDYATDEFRQQRKRFLEDHRILTHSRELEECRRELRQDGLLNDLMSGEEIDALLDLHYHSQQEGQRKLENIKVRVVLDKLSELLIHARELQKQAAVRQQGG
jgi:hypothetical protein